MTLAEVRSSMQFDDDIEDTSISRPMMDAIENIIDAREWDVPYHIRVAIDKGRSALLSFANSRHSNREVVHCQSESWSDLHGSNRRPSKTCRPSGPSIRYRNLEIPTKVP